MYIDLCHRANQVRCDCLAHRNAIEPITRAPTYWGIVAVSGHLSVSFTSPHRGLAVPGFAKTAFISIIADEGCL